MLIKVKRPEYKDPYTELVARLIDRKESEGVVASPTSEPVLSAMVNGFITSFMEEDGKWYGLAYSQKRGKEMEIKTPACPTRKDAAGLLHKWVNSWK